jgi:zinc protease
VRSDMGLAYSVGSRFETDTRYVGDFEAYCQTKTSSTYKAAYNMLDQIKIMRSKKVSDYELKSAKDSYINGFVFQFTRPAQIVSRLMNLEYDGMPRDFYKNYISNIEAVTVDVLAVAKKYLKPDEMTYLVVGKASEFADQLKEFGKVSYIKLENPLADVNQ